MPTTATPLADCGDDISCVGGKGAGLSRLIAAGFHVPPGFVVTTAAFRATTSALEQQVATIVGLADSPESDARASEQIETLLASSGMSAEISAEIREAYLHLGSGENIPVAVRSSAVAEDTADASFAGQQDTYLWVTGAEQVVEHVIACWASVFTPRAIAYRRRFGVPLENTAMAVVVQEMVVAECAGVMMTLEPTTGDPNRVYIEAAFGLGESVVRGEVSPDCFTVDKSRQRIRSKVIGSKAVAYQFDTDGGEVRMMPVSPGRAAHSALSDDEIRELSGLSIRAENNFGEHLEMEWAIGPGRGQDRVVYLLQCRAETVWSKRSVTDRGDAHWLQDPLMSSSAPNLHWTRTNVGEAIPGVLTPLNWSIWAGVGEHSVRASGRAIGALTPAESRMPERPDDHVVRVFHGRYTANVDFIARMGDRLPGVSAEEIVATILGQVPADMVFQPTRRRYPIVAWKMGGVFLRYPRRARALARDYDQWWAQSIATAPELDADGAAALFREGVLRTEAALTLQTTGLLAVIQPLFGILQKIVDKAGFGDVAELSGSGHAEIAVISDMWEVSRGRLTLDEFKRRHGFHGPLEGEIASQVWREDDAPLVKLIEQYTQRPDDQDPARAEDARATDRTRIARKVLNTFPFRSRPVIMLAMELGRRRLPLRGVAKRSFLQGLDVSRAAARRLGVLLVADGALDAIDDVFFLDIDELCNGHASDLRSRVATRRIYWEQHKKLVVPGDWVGIPEVKRLEAASSDATLLTGVGVSPGVVEGRARVLMEPDFTVVEPDEILVAPHTDPSWSSVMFISRALVVDIGGALSHTAVVARELKIPCVVNTCTGTRDLRTGDLIRVDGGHGTVDILERGQQPTQVQTAEDPAIPTAELSVQEGSS
ncbi:PEP-utilizing enzyme [Mycobacterium sp. CVI_P3]|uniref:PEP-utilizing enzyme n=1 Tax=Mycobacterium pinniadriaticum TaxID=2994102 RepID=A0ABT3SCH6_9MYCO|nr:PEP/pyruvate-binding domain-containing protein [Mycobacterium pinniadriaticum]MCX2930668.1 PEP-utilizing enzyme [Mycobacterium pinniadriaticum]MCX2937092.1 PEP-utilizing enzyme [Mycobacterium pinniadriaticum]